jgi:hypothetical protein|tara:strand:+ start:439 stop:1467 length:1029 start_codon:yes stop_codon:yes gene_type:complete
MLDRSQLQQGADGTAQPTGFFDNLTDLLGNVGNFITSDRGNQLLTGAGNYYLGQENIRDVERLGRQTQEQLMNLGQQAAEQTEFRPFTVTTGLGRTTTDATGGTNIGLSPQQQALQNQLFEQAQGLFSRAGVSPTEAQADIYEQIRATQRPDEERERLAMEERLLSQGRLGLQSDAYGGSSPELLALETARQEAMARANLGARNQALAEQQQALAGATGMFSAGFMPQQQALDALRVSAMIPQLAQRGQLSGAELQTQLQRSGTEANLGMMDLASRLRQQRDRGLMESLMGRQPTLQEQIQAQYVGLDPNNLNQIGALTGMIEGIPDLFGSIGRLFGIGGDD